MLMLRDDAPADSPVGEADRLSLTPERYVNWVKRSLNRHFGTSMPADGAASERYRDRVRAFQRETGRSPTGQVDAALQNVIIRRNEKDRMYLSWVRKALAQLDLSIITEGPRRTPDARGSLKSAGLRIGIRAFQKRQGLTPDGFVGAKTETALISRSGIEPPGHVAPGKRKPSPATTPVTIREVQVWLNVFIPKDLPRSVIWKPTFGRYKGRVFVAPPKLAGVAPMSTAFKTDERGWRKKRGTGRDFSRMHTSIWLNTRPKAESSVTENRIGKTIAVDRMGNVVCNRRAAVSDSMSVSSMRRTSTGGFVWDLVGHGRNPCNLEGFLNFLTPEINYELQVRLAFESGRRVVRISVKGNIDDFPAFEMYAQCNRDPVRTLLRRAPSGGPFSLVGGAGRRVDLVKRIAAAKSRAGLESGPL